MKRENYLNRVEKPRKDSNSRDCDNNPKDHFYVVAQNGKGGPKP
jgi:hypothetical protein